MRTRRGNKREEAGSSEFVVISDSENENESESEVEDEDDDDDDDKEGGSSKSKRPRKGDDNDISSQYEQIRDQRIKQNKERMQKLGLLDLSLKLKTKNKNQNNQKPKKNSLPRNQSPARRSSRIMSLAPVSYAEKGREKRDSSNEDNENDNEIFIPEGTNPEFYTKEHEKLLGDCKTAWELNVDGCDVDGNRIYDSIRGETCHQCRQKTLCQHTSCNKCELGQGQLCGDCLYTRYGENLMEANSNPKWTCPSCRRICNCSRCRKANGWKPTGNIYKKVSKLGYKSVAHYLIQTRHAEKGVEGSGDENTAAEEISQTSSDKTQSRPTRSTRRALRRS